MPASIVSSIAKLNRALRFSATTLIGRSFFSATLALLEEITNLGQQFFLPGQLRRWRGFVLALQLVHGANDYEQHERNDEEVQRQRQEIAPSQYGALLFGVGQIG